MVETIEFGDMTERNKNGVQSAHAACARVGRSGGSPWEGVFQKGRIPL